jgi:hypothetical protein
MSQHEEFPALTPEAQRALLEAGRHLDLSQPGWHRRYLANSLRAIANNLHSPPPPAPPPTLTQARAADMDTPEGKAVVRDFLATLGEGGQP